MACRFATGDTWGVAPARARGSPPARCRPRASVASEPHRPRAGCAAVEASKQLPSVAQQRTYPHVPSSRLQQLAVSSRGWERAGRFLVATHSTCQSQAHHCRTQHLLATFPILSPSADRPRDKQSEGYLRNSVRSTHQRGGHASPECSPRVFAHGTRVSCARSHPRAHVAPCEARRARCGSA